MKFLSFNYGFVVLCLVLASCTNYDKIAEENRKLLEQAQSETVIGQLNKYLDEKSTFAEGFNLRGIAYLNKGEAEKALADFNKAIKIDSENYKYFYNRGNVYQQTKQWADALQDYEKAITLNDNVADLHTNRGVVLAFMNRNNEALAALNKSLALNPTDRNALYNRGQIYVALAKFDKAIEDLHHCVEGSPDFAKAHLALALAEINKEEGKATQESCEHLKKAASLNLAEATEMLGKYCK